MIQKAITGAGGGSSPTIIEDSYNTGTYTIAIKNGVFVSKYNNGVFQEYAFLDGVLITVKASTYDVVSYDGETFSISETGGYGNKPVWVYKVN